MDIINKDDAYELILTNDNKDTFIIHYAAGDLYWTMFDYYDDNEFIISKEDEILFYLMNNIFNQINSYKTGLINNNSFEWISEAYGMCEDANRLTIIKENDKFIIKFYQNPNKYVFRKDMCAICFCLSGSKYQDIANAFSLMLYDYIDLDKCKKRKKSN